MPCDASGMRTSDGVDLAQLQRLVVLLRLRDRRAVVLLAGQQHGRRLHVADQRQRRAAPVVLGLLPGRRAEPVAVEERVDVGGQHEAVPVDDRLGDDRRAEAIRLADDPRGQHAAAAAAGDEQVVRDRRSPARSRASTPDIRSS